MRFLSDASYPTVAIDVGTATTRVCTDRVAAVETPSFVRERLETATISRPALRGGVICDVAAAAEVIAPVLRSVTDVKKRPVAIVCAPSDASAGERERLIEAVSAAGARVTEIVPEPLAAAIGIGLDVESETAQMIVDIGEGVTDVVLIAGGEIVTSEARRTGCGAIRQVLVEWLQWHRDTGIDDHAADEIVRAYCGDPAATWFEVRGHDMNDERAVVHLVRREDLEPLLESPLDTISAFVAGSFRRFPEKKALDVIESGLYLTGGGSMLPLLVKRIARRSGLRCAVAADPLRAVIAGARGLLRRRRQRTSSPPLATVEQSIGEGAME